MRRKAGLTVVEIGIGMAILLILLVTVPMAACGQDWERAERDAKEWCGEIAGWEGKFKCAHKDTDNDGYCGCTCFMPDGSRIKLDCGCEQYTFNNAEGCKEVETIKFQGKVRGGGTGTTQ